MTGESRVKVNREQAEAAAAVLDKQDKTTAVVLLLTVYLGDLSQRYGLSENSHVQKVVDHDPLIYARRELGEVAFETIKHLLPEAAAADPDGIRDRIYTALVALKKDPDAQLGPISDPMKLGQIYWCIPRTARRPKLPIAANQPLGSKGATADIKVPGENADYSTMVYSKRIKTPGGYPSSQGGMRDQAARLAVLVAQQLLKTAPTLPANTHIDVTWGTTKGNRPAPTAELVLTITDPNAPGAPSIDVTYERNWTRAEQDAIRRGQWGEAGMNGLAIAAILQNRAAKNPIDHQPQRADRHLQNGLHFMAAGDPDSALNQFVHAIEISSTLNELQPTNISNRECLATSHLMLGITHLIIGDNLAALEATTEATTNLPALMDETGDQEQSIRPLLVLALMTTGQIHLQVDRYDLAEPALTDAVLHAQTLVDNAGDLPELNQWLLGSCLSQLGTLRWHQDGDPEAEKLFAHAADVLRPISRLEPTDPTMGLALSSTPILLAGALYGLGVIQGCDDRLSDCINALTEADNLLETHRTSNSAPIWAHIDTNALHSMVLLFLAFGLGDAGQPREATAVLERAITHLQAPGPNKTPDLEDLELLADAFDTQAALYQQVGRPEDANNARGHAETQRLLIAARKLD